MLSLCNALRCIARRRRVSCSRFSRIDWALGRFLEFIRVLFSRSILWILQSNFDIFVRSHYRIIPNCASYFLHLTRVKIGAALNLKDPRTWYKVTFPNLFILCESGKKTLFPQIFFQGWRYIVLALCLKTRLYLAQHLGKQTDATDRWYSFPSASLGQYVRFKNFHALLTHPDFG